MSIVLNKFSLYFLSITFAILNRERNLINVLPLPSRLSSHKVQVYNDSKLARCGVSFLKRCFDNINVDVYYRTGFQCNVWHMIKCTFCRFASFERIS